MGQLTAAPTQNDLSRKMIVGSKQLVAESEYTSLAEGSLLLCMEEGAEYVVVPSTFNPDIFGHFALKFISSSPVCVRGMNPDTSVVLASKWDDKSSTCGGNHLNDTWDDNPQFQIQGVEGNTYQIRLTRRKEQWSKNDKTDTVGCMLGIYIFEGTEPGTRADLKSGFDAQRTILVPEFLPCHEVSVSVELPLAAHPYIVVPCTFSPGKEGPFLIEVTCPTSFHLERLRKVAGCSSISVALVLRSVFFALLFPSGPCIFWTLHLYGVTSHSCVCFCSLVNELVVTELVSR